MVIDILLILKIETWTLGLNHDVYLEKFNIWTTWFEPCCFYEEDLDNWTTPVNEVKKTM